MVYFGNMIVENIITITLINFALVIFLFWTSYDDIKRAFGKIDKKTWRWLFLIIILGLSLFLLFRQQFFYPYRFEDSLYTSKALALGDSEAYGGYRYGVTYPFVLSTFFRVFGTDFYVVDMLNFTFAILNIIFMFFLSYLFSKNSKAALLSSWIYVLFPLNILYIVKYRTEFIVLQSFVLLFLISLLLAYRIRNSKMFLLSLLILSFLIQFKLEMGIFIPIFVLAGLIYIREKETLKKLIIPIIIFLIFSAPFYEKYTVRSKQECMNVIRPEGEAIPSVLAPIDYILSKTISQEFSLRYFWNNTSSLFKNHPFSMLLLILVILQLFLYKRYPKLRKELAVFLLITISLTFIYTLHCAYVVRSDYQILHTLIILILVIPSTSWAAVMFFRKYFSRFYRKLIVLLIVIILVAFYLPSFYESVIESDKSHYEILQIKDIRLINDKLEIQPTEEVVIITPRSSDVLLWKFLFDYKAYTFNKLIKDTEDFYNWYEEKYTDIEANREDYLDKDFVSIDTLDLRSFKQNYSLYIIYGKSLTDHPPKYIFADIDDFTFECIKHKYELIEEFEYKSNEFKGEHYTIYRLVRS